MEKACDQDDGQSVEWVSQGNQRSVNQLACTTTFARSVLVICFVMTCVTCTKLLVSDACFAL
jgi:hypothetical protein